MRETRVPPPARVCSPLNIPLSRRRPSPHTQVTIFTPHHDQARCFPETTSGAFTVTVAGAWLPRTLAGRGAALCALARCAAAAWALARDGAWDAIIADQVAGAVPALHAFTAWTAPVLFYCHFPDLLLAPPRGVHAPGLPARLGAALRSLYRAPLDALEQAATGAAEAVLVNSRFTAGVFADTFTRLAGRGVEPGVLYPAAAVPTEAALAAAAAGWEGVLPPGVTGLIKKKRGGGGSTSPPSPPPTVFVSINRFERKKDIGLAVRALAVVVRGVNKKQTNRGGGSKKTTTPAAPSNPVLILAGGFDPRLPENVDHLQELQALAAREGVADRVAFLPSFTDAQRGALLAVAAAILYTPSGEHFGIVPVEAGAAGVPVIAVASGGPLESVVDGVTGWLVEAEPAAFAGAMREVVERGAPAVRSSIGAAARAHVIAHFSRPAFGAALEAEVEKMVDAHAGRGVEKVEEEEARRPPVRARRRVKVK